MRAVFQTGSLIYSFELDCVFTSKEMCYSQGWPADLSTFSEAFGGFSNWAIQELAGASYSLPVCTCVAYSFWLNPYAPWWKPKFDTTQWNAADSATDE